MNHVLMVPIRSRNAAALWHFMAFTFTPKAERRCVATMACSTGLHVHTKVQVLGERAPNPPAGRRVNAPVWTRWNICGSRVLHSAR